MVSLLVFLENKFKIKIPPSKATPEAFDSVNNIVALVNQYLNK
jgi:acyl carrier protein